MDKFRGTVNHLTLTNAFTGLTTLWWYLRNLSGAPTYDVLPSNPLPGTIGFDVLTSSTSLSACDPDLPGQRKDELDKAAYRALMIGGLKDFNAINWPNTDYRQCQRMYELRGAYRFMKKNADLLTTGHQDDYFYQSLFSILESTDIARADQFDDAILSGRLELAREINTAMSEGNVWSARLKRVNDIALSVLEEQTFQLSEEIRAELTALAYQSSLALGPGVFRARALLDLAILDPYVSFDDEPEVEIMSKETPLAVIVPNPSMGKFSLVRLRNDGSDYRFELSNILGETVFTSSIFAAAPQTSVDLTGSPAGVYFFRLTCPNKKVQTGKFIIQK